MEIVRRRFDVVDFAGEQSILRLIDNEANEARLNIFRGVAEPGAGAGAADAASVSLLVQNGTGTSGQATEVSDGLSSLGFDTSPGTGDAERFDFAETVVRYMPGQEATAQFVASQLEAGARLEPVPNTYGVDVVVVTGFDYAGIKTTLVPPSTATTAPPASTTSTTLPDLPTTTVAGATSSAASPSTSAGPSTTVAPGATSTVAPGSVRALAEGRALSAA